MLTALSNKVHYHLDLLNTVNSISQHPNLHDNVEQVDNYVFPDTLRAPVRTSAPPPDMGRVTDLGCDMCRVGNVYEQ